MQFGKYINWLILTIPINPGHHGVFSTKPRDSFSVL